MKIIELLLEYDRTITAKNFGAQLQARFGQNYTPEEIVQAIERRDPTPNKEYTQWMIRMLLGPNRTWDIVDMNRDNLLWAHYKGKRKLRPEHRDINNFKSYAAFETTMLDPSLYDLEELVKDPEKVDKGQSTEVYQDADVRIIVPHDQTAACYYGQATKWCTAYTNPKTPNKFKDYSQRGTLFILLPKNRKYVKEKYQIFIDDELGMREFKNDENDEVNPVKLLKQQFPGALEFFQQNYADKINVLALMTDSILQNKIKTIKHLIITELYPRQDSKLVNDILDLFDFNNKNNWQKFKNFLDDHSKKYSWHGLSDSMEEYVKYLTDDRNYLSMIQFLMIWLRNYYNGNI